MSGKRRWVAIIVGIVVAGWVSFASLGAVDAHEVHATVHSAVHGTVHGAVHGGHVAVTPAHWGHGYGWGYRGYGYAPRYYSNYSPYVYAPAYASVYGYAPSVYSYGYAPSVYSYAPSVYSYAPAYVYPPAVRVVARPIYRGRYYW